MNGTRHAERGGVGAGEGTGGVQGPLPPDRCRVCGDLDSGPGWSAHAGLGPDGEAVTLLFARSEDGRQALDALARLLEGLREAGAAALPRVLGLSPSAWVLEDAAPLTVAGGRRRAESGTPSTRERLARAAAREDLDASVAILHDRGLVLGLEPGAGLAVRPDGRVMIRDVRHLARSLDEGARRADQRWVDSVVGDPERTLRRRIDRVGRPPDAPRGDPVFGTPAARPGVGTPAARPGPPVLPEVDAVGTPRDGVALAPASAWRVSPPRRRLRRGARRAGAIVVLAAAAIGLAVVVPWRSTSPEAAPSSTAPMSTVAGEATTAPALAPQDARALVEELSEQRRRSLLEDGAPSPTVPGSSAAREDEAVRAAYAGRDVAGWTTSVESARVTDFDPEAGTASVLARVAESERTVTTEGGGTITQPATAAHDVRLALQWYEGAWRISSVRTA